ncbi:DUF5681 domain-containing protein [Pacificispira sp.]|uniref:DUF5681 domain-containing protein n=1 Tax=Pacificispira sp. TaxID=2888761 RepID=UPI003B52D448
MSDKHYEVGWGKPPKQHRFQPGQSGNPRGRPPKRAVDGNDLIDILDQPIPVHVGNRKQTKHPFEIALRRLAERAIKGGDLKSAIQFLNICIDYGAIDIDRGPPSPPMQYVPADSDYAAVVERIHRDGLPPWPDDPDFRLLTYDELEHYGPR